FAQTLTVWRREALRDLRRDTAITPDEARKISVASLRELVVNFLGEILNETIPGETLSFESGEEFTDSQRPKEQRSAVHPGPTENASAIGKPMLVSSPDAAPTKTVEQKVAPDNSGPLSGKAVDEWLRAAVAARMREVPAAERAAVAKRAQEVKKQMQKQTFSAESEIGAEFERLLYT
ncbi:unnamed protein product, partial [Symbiodinium pilosum]